MSKQTVELDVLKDYELHSKVQNIVMDGRMTTLVFWEKKQTKDFSFYVDQYLYENGSTNDQIVNWLSDDIISVAKHRLKTSQFSLVPWEIKMGLFKFICEEKGEHAMSILSIIVNHGIDHVKFMEIFPEKFLNDLFKTKN